MTIPNYEVQAQSAIPPTFNSRQKRDLAAPVALEGVRVVDFSHVLAGPLATQYLGDFGAEIIKIENPDGGDVFRSVLPMIPNSNISTAFLAANRNKQSVSINIKDPRGVNIVKDIIATADVVVENFTSRVMAGVGLDYPSLKDLFPRLVYLSVSAYGRTGDGANRPGLDPILSAETGLTSMNGIPGGPPITATLPWVDTSVAMNAVIAILIALVARNRIGKGQYIDMSMYDACIAQHSYIGARFLGTGRESNRYGRIRETSAPSGEYDCADGRTVMLFIMNQRMFNRLCREILNRPELLTDNRFRTAQLRSEYAEELSEIVGHSLSREAAEVWAERLMDVGIPAAVVRGAAESLMSDTAQRAGSVTQIPHNLLGAVFNLESPIRRMSMTPPVDPKPAPALGEHTDAVLGEEFGYGEMELQKLERAGIIRRVSA